MSSRNRNYKGIKNSGNWCYLNSILQTLASLPSFVNCLERACTEAAATPSLLYCNTLLRCLKELRSSSSSAIPFDPSPIIELIARAKPQICNRDEQDAQELFEVIADIVSEEMQKATRSLPVCDPRDSESGGLLAAFGTKKEECDATKEKVRRKRPPWLPFQGLQASHVRCTGCNEARVVSNQSFCTLSVAIGLGQGQVPHSTSVGAALSIHDSLRRFIEVEILEEVECDCCSADHLHSGLQDKINQLNDEKECAVNREVVMELVRISKNVKFWRTSGLCSSSEFESWDTRVTEEIVMKYDCSSETGGDSRELELPAVNTAVVDIIDELAGSVRQTTKKRLLLSRLPACLCLHVNRKIADMFTGNLKKIDTFVRFPLLLDLSAYRCGSSGEHRPGSGNPNLYRLKAVVVHFGSADGGHYVTYAAVNPPLEAGPDGVMPSATPGQQWALFSDANVRPVTEDEVLSSRAFLLFYEQNMTRK